VRRKSVFVTPKISAYLEVSLIDNLMFFARLGGFRDRSTRERAEDAMRGVGIADRCFERPLGDQGPAISVLFWLALATLRDAPALIMDEPTAGLNTEDTELVLEAVREQRDAKRAVLIATADVRFATHVGDRVGVLTAGRKVIERGPGGLLGQNLTEFLLTNPDLPPDEIAR
jgi:ABC-type multidrug transport system ATPase subunit